jgi:hypothetical protein
MNERVKALYDQSLIREHGTDYEGNPILKITIDQQKFAELIVTECLRQVEEQYKPVLEDEVMMKDTHWGGYVQCGVDSYVAIREHFFGVEE